MRERIHFQAVLLAVFCGTLLAAVPAVTAQQLNPINGDGVTLIQPLDDETKNIPIEPGVKTWMTYFGTAADWLYNVAVGICVLWVLIGGIHIMVSHDNQSIRQKGISHMIGAITGLVILSFAGTILRFLNKLAYG